MEKSDKEKQGLEQDDSPEAQVAEDLVEDKPQMQEDKIRPDVQEGTKNEPSVSQAAGADNESGQVPKPKAERCEESKQNVTKEAGSSTGTKRKHSAGPVTTQDSATADDSASTETIYYNVTIGQIVDALMNFAPDGHAESSDIPLKSAGVVGDEVIPEQQIVPGDGGDMGVKRDLEQGENPEQELPVQHVRQEVELVPEEAVICDAVQERVEETENMDEPRNYSFRGKDKK